MKLATWNVNSLKVRLPQVLDWLAANPVDVLCLQETKLRDEQFPKDAIAEAGYEAAFAGQPTYNGVAILARRDTVGAPANVVVGNPRFEDEQQRLISATVGGLRVVCAYFPNGQEVGSDKYAYKLRWIDALIDWLAPAVAGAVQDAASSASAGTDAAAPGWAPLALLGDFNIAPEDRDVHDPALWAGKIHCSDEERARFVRLVELGLVDAFRLFDQPPKQFSWWDYRMMGFRRNAGLRIDHILVDAGIAPRVRACAIDREPRKLEKPSDHAPVIVELED
ncbi:exodeoxyribonuclease III [Burkholderiaceae bacterium FT117]|uniref:exodeoxyribonuclease III n=1 Tax=Zeimonas sediminis TaxID=2944268 RepID=UPI002342E75B|nr:exodeoxyribonuclease III [Zeimonas sediminis]MCM5571986.1 exodeoxyribonuclease III [Zeimonas sediminis]